MAIKNIYSNLERNLEKTISNSKQTKSNKYAFDSIKESVLARESFSRSGDLIKNSMGMEGMELTSTVGQSYGVKEIVRNRFGKHGALMPTIGCHPDFEGMREGELRNGYSVTMFMDIIGSTKLGVLFEPETVFKIKNDIIRCAIETINSFDGHVHRIMGDAVMAFFRSEEHSANGTIADSAIDALNCATFLIDMFKEVVIPMLNEFGIDENLGIRIGIDYGSDKEVVWGRYGYMDSNEVTATSFFVDVAAKLQQKAPKNSIMIGASLVELLGLDHAHLDIKTKTKNNEKVYIKHLTPNYIDATGKPINYEQYVLKNINYSRLLPVFDAQDALYIKANLKRHKEDTADNDYITCSRVIKKGLGIYFKGYYHSTDTYANPRFKFRVENNGPEAKDVEDNGNHEEFEAAKWSGERYFAKHWEETSYRGLHHMYVSFWDGERLIEGEKCFSVFIND